MSNNATDNRQQTTTGLQSCMRSITEVYTFQTYLKRPCVFQYVNKYFSGSFLKINAFSKSPLRHNTVHTTRGMYTYSYPGVLHLHSQCLSLHTPLDLCGNIQRYTIIIVSILSTTTCLVTRNITAHHSPLSS
jgi:hypothetical protein